MLSLAAQVNGPVVLTRGIHFAASAATAGILIFRALVAEPALHLAPEGSAAVRSRLTKLALIAAAPARADEVKAGDIVINQAWAPPTPKGAKVGGGYLTIENKGSAPDRLTGAPLTLPAACRCTKCLCRTAS